MRLTAPFRAAGSWLSAQRQRLPAFRVPLPAPLARLLQRLGALVAQPYRWLARLLYRYSPKGLFPRTLLILVVPLVIMQAVLAFVFLERHYNLVTQRLSDAVVRDIALLADLIGEDANEAQLERLTTLARDNLDLNVTILPLEPLPAPRPKPFFDIVDRYLSQQIGQRIARPFWIDTVGRSSFVEIRIQL